MYILLYGISIAHDVMLLTFKAMQGIGPSYLRELLQAYKPSRSLRSSNKNFFNNS